MPNTGYIKPAVKKQSRLSGFFMRIGLPAVIFAAAVSAAAGQAQLRPAVKPAQQAYLYHAPAPYDDNNVFARILRHQKSAARVYEDAYSLVFMDINPRSRGHMLVIPKCRCRNLLDADPKMLQQLILTVQKMAQAALPAFHAAGVTIRQNNEVASEQSVFHLHFHVMPRYNGVPLSPSNDRPPAPPEKELEREAAAMRRVLQQFPAALPAQP